MRAGAKSRQETATYLISHPVRVQILTIANAVLREGKAWDPGLAAAR